MKRLALALLIVLVAGCVTYPPPKIEDGRYQNYKYGFVLELPGSDWVLMEKPPPQLTGVTPREMRKQIMLALFNKEISAAIIVVAEKTMLFQGLIFQSDSLQAAILAELSKQPEVKDARDCHDSRTYMQDWDICIEFDFEDAVSKAKGNMFMRLFPVGNDVHTVMVQLGSNHITYEQSFPAFVKIINSLRCGEYYRTVPDMLEVAEDVHLGKEVAEDVHLGKEVAEDVRFVKYDNGIVYDAKTDLEWYAGPDRDTTWEEAREWANNLSLDGGGWRMPTGNELSTLYQRGKGARNISPLFETTGWWIWTNWTIEGRRSQGFRLDLGFEDWEIANMSSTSRAFAVRSR
jgi:hypothetical protein